MQKIPFFQVPLNTTVMPRTSKSSPAVAATLISPEDFERSSTTPQKKLELKQRMLQEVKQPIPQPNLATVPLTKQQLQQTLVSLLQVRYCHSILLQSIVLLLDCKSTYSI